MSRSSSYTNTQKPNKRASLDEQSISFMPFFFSSTLYFSFIASRYLIVTVVVDRLCKIKTKIIIMKGTEQTIMKSDKGVL